VLWSRVKSWHLVFAFLGHLSCSTRCRKTKYVHGTCSKPREPKQTSLSPPDTVNPFVVILMSFLPFTVQKARIKIIYNLHWCNRYIEYMKYLSSAKQTPHHSKTHKRTVVLSPLNSLYRNVRMWMLCVGTGVDNLYLVGCDEYVKQLAKKCGKSFVGVGEFVIFAYFHWNTSGVL
jgi:hypothetical protein